VRFPLRRNGRARREEPAALVLQRERLGGLDRRQFDGQRPDGRGVRVGAHGLSGRQDRAVAGAAAEVAGERILQGARVRRAAFALVGVEAHHEPRRAEAALAGVVRHHRLLDRMQAPVAPQALDGKQRPAVEHRGEQDAGVDRPEAHAAVLKLAQHDGAGAAVALSAALLGPGAAQVIAQQVQHRQRRVDVGTLADLAIQQESDRPAHRQLPR